MNAARGNQAMQESLKINAASIGGLDTSASNQQYFTFILNEQEYGVDILRVQEIRGWTAVRKMPNLPHYIKGVIDLRGTVVPIIDLSERFSMGSKEYSSLTVVIILKVYNGSQEKIMGMVVDSVSDVYEIPPNEIKPAPDLGGNIDTDYIKGLATVQDKMVLLIDIDHLLGEDLPANVDAPKEATPQSAQDQKSGLNVAVLRSSFEALAPKGAELVKRFYEELFRKYPDVKPMFEETSIEDQEKKLLGALQLVINNLSDPNTLKAALQNLGAKHQAYGAVAEHYDAVAGVLLSVMKEMAGDLWTAETSSAWMAALTDVKEIMLSGYE